MAANDAAIATDDEVDEGGSSDEEVPEQDTTPTHHLNSVAEEEKVRSYFSVAFSSL